MFPIAVVTYPDTSKLRKEWYTLAHSLDAQFIILVKYKQEEFQAAGNILSAVRKQRTMSASVQLIFSFVFSPG